MRDLLLIILIGIYVLVMAGKLIQALYEGGRHPHVSIGEWVFYWLALSVGVSIAMLTCIKVIIQIT